MSTLTTFIEHYTRGSISEIWQDKEIEDIWLEKEEDL